MAGFLREASCLKAPIRVNLGCGIGVLSGWINIDGYLDIADLRSRRGKFRRASVDPDAFFIKADMCDLPLPENTADLVECDCAIEHVPFGRTLQAVREMYRVLKPGGRLRIQTTNFDELAWLWIKRIGSQKEWSMEHWCDLSQVIYGGQLHAGDFHKSLFNPRYFAELLANAGFESPINLQIFPTNCSSFPVFESHPKALRKGMVTRTEMIYAEVTKRS